MKQKIEFVTIYAEIPVTVAAFEQKIDTQLRTYGEPLSSIVLDVDVTQQVAEVLAVVAIS